MDAGLKVPATEGIGTPARRPGPMQFRFARQEDCALLAELNSQLIRDEGHRNSMTPPQLTERMSGWLASDYRAVIFENAAEVLGYALYRTEPDYIYLRQFLVCAAVRRRGIGRRAIEWLRCNAWRGAQRVRIDVLVGNAAGIAFWRAVGFRDYCLTMEAEQEGG
jgi:GNAT superfamily N-acetyltransferase